MNISSLSIFGACGLALLGASSAVRAADQVKPSRPNILFLLADDLRWDALSFMGKPMIKTPNLDSVARRGVIFQQSFVTTPICAIGRASVLTGQYARRHGVHDFATPIADLSATYPAVLRANGYYTGFIGKWGVDASNTNTMRQCALAFDYWAGDRGQTSYWHERDCNYIRNNGTTERENYHCSCPPGVFAAEGTQGKKPHSLLKDPVHLETQIIPEKVKQFLDQRDPAKPFNLSVSFKAPHGPLGGFAPTYAHRLESESLPFRGNATAQEAQRQPEFLRKSLEGPRGWRMAHNQGPESEAQDLLRDYYRLVEGMDFSVGRILDELRSRGLAGNTIIIFTSDNGHMHGEHGFFGKWLLYEESIRVPMFICDPRPGAMKAGSSSEALVLNIDVAPTILDLAGAPIPAAMQGRSLKPLLAQPDAAFRYSFFCEHLYEHGAAPPMHIEPSEGLRSREWKYIRYLNQTGPLSEELYHLGTDPLEMTNRIADVTAAAALENMRREYERLRTALGPYQTWTRKPAPAPKKKAPARKS